MSEVHPLTGVSGNSYLSSVLAQIPGPKEGGPLVKATAESKDAVGGVRNVP